GLAARSPAGGPAGERRWAAALCTPRNRSRCAGERGPSRPGGRDQAVPGRRRASAPPAPGPPGPPNRALRVPHPRFAAAAARTAGPPPPRARADPAVTGERNIRTPAPPAGAAGDPLDHTENQYR